MVSDGIMDGRGEALLAPLDVPQDAAWDAALVVAGHAADAGELREWMEMLGLAAYEPGFGTDPWGTRRGPRGGIEERRRLVAEAWEDAAKEEKQ